MSTDPEAVARLLLARFPFASIRHLLATLNEAEREDKEVVIVVRPRRGLRAVVEIGAPRPRRKRFED